MVFLAQWGIAYLAECLRVGGKGLSFGQIILRPCVEWKQVIVFRMGSVFWERSKREINDRIKEFSGRTRPLNIILSERELDSDLFASKTQVKKQSRA